MSQSELNTKNYKRIFYINILLSVPLLVLFAWPFVVFCRLLSVSPLIFYPGSLLFSFPFMLTILHGHVTLALGSAHRHHYYSWLENNTLTYGLLYHPMFSRTRFRLVVFALSVMVMITGWLIKL
jgi:hypothetical protein